MPNLDPVGGLLEGIFGSFAQNRATKWDQNARVNILNLLQAANEFGVTAAGSFNNFLRDKGLDNVTRSNLQLYGGDGSGGLFDDIISRLSDFSQFGGKNIYDDQLNPHTSQAVSDMRGAVGQRDPLMQYLQSIFSSGSALKSGETLRGRLDELANGMGADMGVLSDVGQEILGQRGETAYLKSLQDRSDRVMDSSGLTPELQDLIKTSFGLVQADGSNPVIDFLTSRGQKLASKDPLLDTDQAFAIARDSAARQSKSAAEKARSESYKRGGGPGTLVGSGVQTEALNDFFDQALEAQAAAGQNALVNQQGLGLQQQGLGFNAVGAGQSQATQRLLSAMGLIPQAAGVGVGREGTYGQLGLGGVNAGTQRLGTGAGLLGQFNSTKLQALSQLLGVDVAELGQMLGAGQLYNQGVEGNIGAQRSIGDLGLAGLGLNLNRANTGIQQQLGGMDRSQSLINSILGFNTSNTNTLADMGRSYLQYATSANSGLPGVFQGYQTTPVNWGTGAGSLADLLEGFTGGSGGASGGK